MIFRYSHLLEADRVTPVQVRQVWRQVTPAQARLEEVTNWAGSLSVGEVRVFYPTTVEGLRAVVAWASSHMVSTDRGTRHGMLLAYLMVTK